MAKILPALKADLFYYNVNHVAGLSDSAITKLFNKYNSQVKARFLSDELLAIRDNAKVFQHIASNHGSVCSFIKGHLPATSYNSIFGCYIHPADRRLMALFTASASKFKLRAVGLAICCEFFKNIGIDELKPDLHTISFLNRIDLDRTKTKVSRRPDDVREIGIRISETLKQPRSFVDILIWCFCADGEGEICTEDDPKCESCWLKIKEPMFCKGFPSRADIVSNPVAAAKRFQECNLRWKEASRKMKKAGLAPGHVRRVITTITDSGQ
ncbi:MAG: hypothetical protein ACUVTR_07295 [Dehalococcoidia bacterium]